MQTKTINLFTKAHGCSQCDMTKNVMKRKGVAKVNPDNPAEVVSAVEGVEIKTVHIDDPANADVLERLKEQGLNSAPVVMLNFPITVAGEQVSEWAGFMPANITELAKAVA